VEPIQREVEFWNNRRRGMVTRRGMRGMLGGRCGQVNSAVESIEAIYAVRCDATAALVLKRSTPEACCARCAKREKSSIIQAFLRMRDSETSNLGNRRKGIVLPGHGQ
jgi:hypothetical protein